LKNNRFIGLLLKVEKCGHLGKEDFKFKMFITIFFLMVELAKIIAQIVVQVARRKQISRRFRIVDFSAFRLQGPKNA
jgi:hypothetical protein